MNQTVDISKRRYEELKKNPVFFLKLIENGNTIVDSTWRSPEHDLNINLYADDFADRTIKYTLCIIDKIKEKKDDKGNVIPDIVTISIHSASPNSENDWIYIINSFIIRSQNEEDKYAFMELLWALDNLQWNKRTLISVLSKYPPQTIPFLITNFQKFGRVLSYYKQKALKSVCTAYNGQYNIYSPDIIKQAYDCIPNETDVFSEQSKPDYKSLNIFSIIDAIFEQYSLKNVTESIATSNPLLKIHSWFHSEVPLEDYSILLKIYPTFSDKYRLLSVKRYFHDLRNKCISLDISFLQMLKENRYDDFIRYRYCVESPTEPIILTVPLLCDTLITLYSSNGHSFQTFDGLLDFAMTHCDTIHPAINFKLEGFIPTCNKGVTYNSSFKGFIDYALIHKLNESMMTPEHLRSTLTFLMDKNAKRQAYPACKYGDGSIIPDEIFRHCSHIRKSKNYANKQVHESSWGFECYHYLLHEDRWIIKHEKLDYIKEFLKEGNIQYSPEYNISLDMLSTEKLKEYIVKLPKKFKIIDNNEFLIHSYNKNAVSTNFDLYLVQEYSDILRMRIFPQNGALVGLQFDIFGFWGRNKKDFPTEALRYTQSEQFKKAYADIICLESQEVRRRCIDSLKKELNSEFLDNSYFEIPYNKVLLSNTIKRFYHKDSFNERDHINQHEFLTKSHINNNFVQYCAPQLSEEKNPAINLPYFWCRGKECFQNNLGTQTLEEESDWTKYSLFHS